MGHFGEVLKDEFIVSAGGNGGVMQMPVPINALEKWHQHQQAKQLIDEGRATVYIKERTPPPPALKADQQVWLLRRTNTTPFQRNLPYVFLDIRTEDLVRCCLRMISSYKYWYWTVMSSYENLNPIHVVSATRDVLFEALWDFGPDTVHRQFTHRG